MAVENRLSADQLAALAPGDEVGIESWADFGRTRRSAGTVVRVETAHIVVSCCSPRQVRYVERFGRRDGVRVGGGQRAELVNPAPADQATPERRRHERRIDAAYRAWTRNRADVDALRELQAAIEESLSRSS